MKKILVSLVATILLLTACGSGGDDDKTKDLILNKVFWGQSLGSELDFQFMAFYDDNTLRGVNCDKIDILETVYGTYSINENSLTLKIGSEEYSGVVIDEGKKIMIGKQEWLEYNIGNDDKLKKAIAK